MFTKNPSMLKKVIDVKDELEDLVHRLEGVAAIDLTDVAALRHLQERVANIVMPWEPDGCIPPNFVRRTFLGKQVGIVDCHLAGYANDSHNPEKNSGWGLKAEHKARCRSGIVPTLQEAKDDVDDFLQGEGFKLLDD